MPDVLCVAFLFCSSASPYSASPYCCVQIQSSSCQRRLNTVPAMEAPKPVTFNHLKDTPTCAPPFPTSYPHLSRPSLSTLSPLGLNCHPLWHNLIQQKRITVLPVNILMGLHPAPLRPEPFPGLHPPFPPSIKAQLSLTHPPLEALPCLGPLQTARLSSQLTRTATLLCIRHTAPVKVRAHLRAWRCTSPTARLCISPMQLNAPLTKAM